MKKEIEELKALINDSNNIVFFGGAGVSTESNIPDFRSKDGLYSRKFDLPPERILSHSFFTEYPDKYFEVHLDRLGHINAAAPNKAHLKLAELEAAGKLKAVVTQNIDNLHHKAGSKNVFELHGSAVRNYCIKCRKKYPVCYVLNSGKIPRCECGGIVRPDIVMFEEALNEDTVAKAIEYISRADVLIVGGTSLVVYPAAGFINCYRGKKLVLINQSETSFDEKADLVIRDSIGEALGQVGFV